MLNDERMQKLIDKYLRGRHIDDIELRHDIDDSDQMPRMKIILHQEKDVESKGDGLYLEGLKGLIDELDGRRYREIALKRFPDEFRIIFWY